MRGRGERGQGSFCGSHTGSFCLKPSLGWMWADKWEKGRAGRCSRRPATTSALMLLCLASRCPPSLLPAMGHRCLDPPGFLPFVQMHPAGSLAWTNLHEKSGPARANTLRAPLCGAKPDRGGLLAPCRDLGKVWSSEDKPSLGVSTPRNPLCLLSLLPSAVGTSALHVWQRTNAIISLCQGILWTVGLLLAKGRRFE